LLRNRWPATIRYYVTHVASLAQHYRQSPEHLDQDQVRSYLLYLMQDARATRFLQPLQRCRFGKQPSHVIALGAAQFRPSV